MEPAKFLHHVKVFMKICHFTRYREVLALQIHDIKDVICLFLSLRDRMLQEFHS